MAHIHLGSLSFFINKMWSSLCSFGFFYWLPVMCQLSWSSAGLLLVANPHPLHIIAGVMDYIALNRSSLCKYWLLLLYCLSSLLNMQIPLPNVLLGVQSKKIQKPNPEYQTSGETVDSIVIPCPTHSHLPTSVLHPKLSLSLEMSSAGFLRWFPWMWATLELESQNRYVLEAEIDLVAAVWLWEGYLINLSEPPLQHVR